MRPLPSKDRIMFMIRNKRANRRLIVELQQEADHIIHTQIGTLSHIEAVLTEPW